MLVIAALDRTQVFLLYCDRFQSRISEMAVELRDRVQTKIEECRFFGSEVSPGRPRRPPQRREAHVSASKSRKTRSKALRLLCIEAMSAAAYA